MTKSTPSSLLDLAKERRRRREAREGFLEFCIEALKPIGEKPAKHHRLLIKELQGVADLMLAGMAEDGAEDDAESAPDAESEIESDVTPSGLIVNLPPGSAKSTYASVLFPAWIGQRRKRLNILGASHTGTLAESFSKRVQKTITENERLLGYHVETFPAHLWETSLGGQYKASGAGSAIAGFRADLGVIDDPIGLQADAESPNFREKLWNWYQFDFFPRLKPNAFQVIIQTRWHEEDLSGRLIREQPGFWRIVSIPAEAVEGDPLGRAPGEMLWGDQKAKYDYAALLRRAKARLGPRVWGSLYQQDPKPMVGGIFKTEQIQSLPALPAACRRPVRAWDLAATKQTGKNDPDWTAGLKLWEWPGVGYVVEDVRRIRDTPEQIEAAIVATASRDSVLTTVLLPQDPGQAGKMQSRYLTRALSRYVVKSSVENGDKATRAMPAAAQANVGNLYIVAGEWNKPFLEELASFPGNKDDQVDALSRAMNELSGVVNMADRWANLS